MTYSIPELPYDSFSWSRWRACDVWTRLRIPWRTSHIIANKDNLMELAVGYCWSHRLPCRPKDDCVAVMFLCDDIFQWCHMNKVEFHSVFGNI
jgi:hypothetical protein